MWSMTAFLGGRGVPLVPEYARRGWLDATVGAARDYSDSQSVIRPFFHPIRPSSVQPFTRFAAF